MECLDITGPRIETIKPYINKHEPRTLRPLPGGPTVYVRVIQKRNQFQNIYELVSSSTGLPIPWTDATYALKRQGFNYVIVPESVYKQFRPEVQIVDQEKLRDIVSRLLHSDFFVQFGDREHFISGDIKWVSFNQHSAYFHLDQPDSRLYYYPGSDRLSIHFFERPNCSSFRDFLEVNFSVTDIADDYRRIIDKNLEDYSFLSLDDSCYDLDGRSHNFEITHNSNDKSFCLRKILK